MKTEKTLSLILAAVIPFPFLLTGMASTLEKISLDIILGGIIAAAAAWSMGTALGIFLKKAKGKLIYAVRISIMLIGVMIAALSEILIFSLQMDSLALVFIPAAYVFWYWFGFRTGGKQNIISHLVLGAYAVEAAFMYPICNSFNQRAAFSIIIITALVTILGALLINFRQIKRLSLRGKSENKLLTKVCTRFNTKSALIFCGIVLFAFFFCGVGARWLWECVKAFIGFIVYLIGLLGAVAGGSEYEAGEITDELRKQFSENSGSKYFMWIIAVVLVIIFLKPIVKAIRNLCRSIIAKLGRDSVQKEELQYTDIYQEISTGRILKNDFKKAYKAFLRERNTDKKFHLGYKALMTGLTERELELVPSDTPLRHFEKGKSVIQSPSFSKIVDKYCNVRYDDTTPAKEDCEVMRELLKEIK